MANKPENTVSTVKQKTIDGESGILLLKYGKTSRVKSTILVILQTTDKIISPFWRICSIFISSSLDI